MSLEEFEKEVKLVTTKGKLQTSIVENIVNLAMNNISSDVQLVSILFRAHKKASSQTKLSSLYLLDAISREAKSRAKKLAKGKGKGVQVAETSPVEGEENKGTFSSFLSKVEGLLSKLVLDCWENGLIEHREKVRKVLDIWTKAETFTSAGLARITSKLLASDTAALNVSAASKPKSTSNSNKSPSPLPHSPVGRSSELPTIPGAIPASVLALLAATAATSSKPSDTEIAQRAIAEAKLGLGISGQLNPVTPVIPNLASLVGADALALLQQALTASSGSNSNPSYNNNNNNKNDNNHSNHSRSTSNDYSSQSHRQHQHQQSQQQHQFSNQNSYSNSNAKPNYERQSSHQSQSQSSDPRVRARNNNQAAPTSDNYQDTNYSSSSNDRGNNNQGGWNDNTSNGDWNRNANSNSNSNSWNGGGGSNDRQSRGGGYHERDQEQGSPPNKRVRWDSHLEDTSSSSSSRPPLPTREPVPSRPTNDSNDPMLDEFGRLIRKDDSGDERSPPPPELSPPTQIIPLPPLPLHSVMKKLEPIVVSQKQVLPPVPLIEMPPPPPPGFVPPSSFYSTSTVIAPPPPPPSLPAPVLSTAPIEPFDPATFSSYSPASWASYGEYLRTTYGVLPSSEVMITWISTTMNQQMSMMQQQQQQMMGMYGAGGGMGEVIGDGSVVGGNGAATSNEYYEGEQEEMMQMGNE